MVGTTTDNQPFYNTFGAIYHDVKDDYDGQSYYYMAFIMSDYTELVKVNSVPDPTTSNPQMYRIKWNYQYKDSSSDAWKNKKTPRFLAQDKRQSTSMLFLGRHYGRASVMRFDKRSAALDWRIEVRGTDLTKPTSKMTDILDYVQPDNSRDIYACGFAFNDAETESTAKKAVVFKVSN